MRPRHPAAPGGPVTAPTARGPPRVERLLAAVRARRTAGQDQDALVVAARQVLADERDRLLVAGPSAEATLLADLADALVARLDAWAAAPSVATINATGVIVHTNLGRAPWPDEAVAAAVAAAGPHPPTIHRE